MPAALLWDGDALYEVELSDADRERLTSGETPGPRPAPRPLGHEQARKRLALLVGELGHRARQQEAHRVG